MDMSNSTANSANGVILTTQDGVPLKTSIARALRREKLRALMLIAPLLLFILLTFAMPIVDMLFRSVENAIVSETLPRTVKALKGWDELSGELPGEPVFAALHEDLVPAVEAKSHTRLGSRLNYEKSGMSSMFRSSGRKVSQMTDGDYKAQFIEANNGWGEIETWQIIKRFSGNLTDGPDDAGIHG